MLVTRRRSQSMTSLDEYADTVPPRLDLCDAFEAVGDAGADVLFARMRGASQTMGELLKFWKERSAIEEEYAKRLAKLAKMKIGEHESGELRNSIDVLLLESDKQAGIHAQLAQQIRTDLELPVGAFVTRQQHHKKTYQAVTEREYKAKQMAEEHGSGCLSTFLCKAQSTLAKEKDQEKRARTWEQDWRAYCDSCQDLEEKRMEFIKDNLWAYANAVSTVCVVDDNSCEKVRLALERLEPEQDLANFVRDNLCAARRSANPFDDAKTGGLGAS